MPEAGDVQISSLDRDIRPRTEGGVGKAISTLGMEEIGFEADVSRLERREGSEYSGAVGWADRLFREGKSFFGVSGLGREVKDYTEHIKGSESGFDGGVEEFFGRSSEDQAEMMVGGMESVKQAVDHLIETVNLEDKNFLEGLEREVQKAKDWYGAATAEDVKKIEEYSEGVIEARQNTMASLGQLWEVQDKVDDARRAEYMAKSYDEKWGMDEADRYPGREGGLVRRAVAWVKGIPRGAKERASATLSPHEFTRGKIRAEEAKLKADVLGRVGPEERAEMWRNGVLDVSELGTVPDGVLDIGEQDAFGRKENFNGWTSAGMQDRLENYRGILEDRMETELTAFQGAKEKWEEYAGKSLQMGFTGAPITDLVAKVGSKGVRGVVAFGKAADGSLEVVVESAEKMVAQSAIDGLIGASVGRKMTAESYIAATRGGDQGQSVKLASALRGADMMIARAMLRATRASENINAEFSTRSPESVDLVKTGVREVVDGVTGGILAGELTKSAIAELAERSNKILAGEGLLEGFDSAGETSYQEFLDIQSLIKEKTVDLPDHFQNKVAMLNWLGEGKIREIGFKMLSKLVDPDTKKGDFAKMVNEGSARRTLGEVLGEKTDEGSLLNKIWATAALRKQKGELLELGRLGVSGEEMDEVVEHASLTSLGNAQEKYLDVEIKQMKRRAKLDQFWIRSTQVAGGIAAAASLEAVSGPVSHWLENLAENAQAQVNVLGQQVADIKSALTQAANPDNFVDPLHQEWALDQGGTDLFWADVNLAKAGVKLGAEQFGAFVATKSQFLFEYAKLGLLAVGAFGGSVQAVKSTFIKKTGLGKQQATVQ